MPKNPIKEERELWALGKFRELYPVPEGPVDSSDESPDLVIHASTGRVGIEVTDIQPENGKGGSSVMRDASERAAVMRKLKALLKKSNAPAIDVSYHGDLPERKRTGQDDLAKRLARYISPRIPPEGEVFSKCANQWPYDPELPPEVFALTIARYRCLTEISCDSGEAVFIPDLAAADVERCVAKKNGKVSAYRQRCDEAWLLMCVNTTDLATYYSLDNFLVPEHLTTDFDRVFVLSILEPRLEEVRCVQREQAQARSGPGRFRAAASFVDCFKHRQANGGREVDQPHILPKPLLATLRHEHSDGPVGERLAHGPDASKI